MMLRQLVKVTDAYPLTEADIALITTAFSLHDIGKIRIPEPNELLKNRKINRRIHRMRFKRKKSHDHEEK